MADKLIDSYLKITQLEKRINDLRDHVINVEVSRVKLLKNKTVLITKIQTLRNHNESLIAYIKELESEINQEKNS